MNQPLPISAFVEVAASPESVWEVVSDVRRMSEWSPECRRIVVIGSPKQGVGTTFLGLNRRGWATDPSTTVTTTVPAPETQADIGHDQPETGSHGH